MDLKEYARYILPGQIWRDILLFGENEILLQRIDGGVFLHEFHRGILVREKILIEVTVEQARAMMRLGESEGEDFSHCLFLAWKHSEDFLDKVMGYCEEVPMHGCKTRFDFYGAGSS
jgi:hypothetical protein